MIGGDRMDNFGKRLSEIRKEKKMSQAELAKRLKVSRPTITQWESGVKVPTSANLDLLIRVLDVSIDWLTGKSEIRYTAEEQEVNKKLADHIPLDKIAAEHNMTYEDKVLTQSEKESVLAFVDTLMKMRTKKD